MVSLKGQTTIPTIFAVFLSLTLVSGVIYAVSAQITGDRVELPFVIESETTVTDLQEDLCDYKDGYNVTSNRYDYIDVTVHNFGLVAASADVKINLYDGVGGTGNVIASGVEPTGTVAGVSSVIVRVTLTWGSGYDISDFASIRRAIVP